MTTTAIIAFQNGDPLADLLVDNDVIQLHPDMANNRWQGKESYRDSFVEAFNKTVFDLGNVGLSAAYILASAANLVWFKRVVMYQALIIIFRDFRTESGDRWDKLIGDYQAQYDLALNDPTLDYDTAAEAAAIAADTTKAGQIRFIR